MIDKIMYINNNNNNNDDDDDEVKFYKIEKNITTTVIPFHFIIDLHVQKRERERLDR